MLKSEFDRALKDLNSRKAPGVNKIPVELLRSARDKVLERLFKLLGKIYASGELPTDFKKSIVVIITKKKGGVSNTER